MSYLTQSGPLIWLVLLLGVVALASGVRFALGRQPRDASLALGAAVASAIVGLLATVLGFQMSVNGLRGVAAEDRWIYLFGLQESLNNLVVALAVAVLVTLLLMVGNVLRTRPAVD